MRMIPNRLAKHALPIFALTTQPRPSDRETVFRETVTKEGR